MSARLPLLVPGVLALVMCAPNERGDAVPAASAATLAPAAAVPGAAAPCGTTIQAVQRCVTAAAQPLVVRRLPAQVRPAVVLYVDRSGSMTGYLDAAYEDSVMNSGRRGANLRAVLGQLYGLAGSSTRVFGFGDALVPLASGGGSDVVAALVRQDFYRNRDTKTEQVLDRIALDSARNTVHLVITDGRRGSGDAALSQYVRLGTVARQWTADGRGVFAIGASLMPFRQVRNDRAGCWQPQPGRARCPLYVFAFAPATMAEPVLAALASVSERLYVLPAYSDERAQFDYAAAGQGDGAGGGGELGRVRAAPLAIRFRSRVPENRLATAMLEFRIAAGESAMRFSLDDELATAVEMAPLVDGAPAWTTPRGTATAWVEPRGATGAGRSTVVVPVALKARRTMPPAVYRIGVLTTGRPRWLRDFEAATQRDSVRTFGLSSLFTQLAPEPALLSGFYIGLF